MQETNSNVQQGTLVSSKPRSTRGFASMDKEKHKQVSSKGGQSPRETKPKYPASAERLRGELF